MLLRIIGTEKQTVAVYFESKLISDILRENGFALNTVYIEDGKIKHTTIGNAAGIGAIAVLLSEEQHKKS